jgi:hypothetical protein
MMRIAALSAAMGRSSTPIQRSYDIVHDDAFQQFKKKVSELAAAQKQYVVSTQRGDDGNVMSHDKGRGFYFSLKRYRMTVMLYRNKSEPARAIELVYTENIWAWLDTEDLMTGEELAKHLFREIGF